MTMNYEERFLTGEEFFELTGIKLENELQSTSDNPSAVVLNMLKRVERIVDNYISSDFYNNVAYRFQNFTNEQKEWYKLAIAEQALYMLKNGDLSLDSGYTKDKGSVATRNEINNIQISQETIRYLTRLGLRCTHLGVNDSSSNGNILGYLDI